MCGITGFLGGDCTNTTLNESTLLDMTDQLLTRGPDSSGIWLDASAKIGLAHVIGLGSACGIHILEKY